MFQVYISYVRRKKKTSSSVSMTLCVFFSFLFLLNSLKPKQKEKLFFIDLICLLFTNGDLQLIVTDLVGMNEVEELRFD